MKQQITKIYLVENCYDDPNKVYVGKTKNTREKIHKKEFGNNIFYNYIDEINSLERKKWRPLECYWIHQFKAWGFEVMNKNDGGGGPNFHNENTKFKIGNKQKGISKNKGKQSPNKGKFHHVSEETKQKMRKPKLTKEKHFVPILQYTLQDNLIKEWSSIKEAAEFYKTDSGTLCQCLKGRIPTVKKFKWKYK